MRCLRTSSMAGSRSNKQAACFLTVCIVLLVAAVLLSLCVGAVLLKPSELFGMLSYPGSGGARIFWHVRLPRTLAAVLAGSALAVVGILIQTVLNNPLAGPNIIGVNSGAGLGAVLAFALFPTLPKLVPLTAFIGALLAVLLVYGLSRKIRASHMTLILAGVAVNAFLSAGIDLIIMLVPDAMLSSNTFRNGGLAGITLKRLSPAWLAILACIILAWMMAKELDILGLGEETARSLGLSTERVRLIFLVLAAALAGTAISISGLLGFVGLIVPHVVRLFAGNEAGRSIPAAAILGAAFLTFCDVLARSLFAPYEIPVGILLSMLGGPFFLWLIARRCRHV